MSPFKAWMNQAWMGGSVTKGWFWVALCALMVAVQVEANPDKYRHDIPFIEETLPPKVVVTAPYLEMRSGPGSKYPVFYVVPEGDAVEVLLRKTHWYKVQTRRGKTGWVSREQMAQTIDSETSEPVVIAQYRVEDFANRRWEFGSAAGQLSGAHLISIYGSYQWTKHLATEINLGKSLGSFSDSDLSVVSLIHTPFPNGRFVPYLTIGAGLLNTSPKATLVATEDRSDEVVNVGFGLKTYVARRFMVRAQYRSNIILTSENDNEEVDEWTIGLSLFF